MRTIRLRMLLLFLCGLLISCATLTGGNGSETTNGYVIGRLVNPDGSPAAPTQVSLLTWNYNPVKDGAIPDSQIATTGGTGEFSFHAPGKGAFNIEAYRKVSGERALIAGISVNENDTTFLPDHAIGKPGAIKIILPPTVDSVHGYVYLPGTTRFAGIKNNDALVDSVPAGIIPAVSYADRIDTAQNGVVKTNVPVAPGDTIVIADYQTWKNSKKIILNTTASGADVPGTVMDFPVLIRLNSAKFDFSQAKPDGGDLRFSKADGSPLPFEIERWDPFAGLAEAWVKIDTVHGNDSAQFVMLYWGNPASTTGSNSAMVFDTTTGFQGVWHLGDAGDSVRDATANRYQGLSPDSARPSVAEGVIGNCREFDGAGDFVTMPNTATGKLNFPENGNFSVSAWVYADTLDNGYHVIAAKGYQQYYLWLTYFPSTLWEFSNFSQADNWHMSNSPAKGKQWVLLTGVRQGSMQSLYCNGELVANTSAIYPQGVSRDTSNDFTIGRFLKEATYPTRFGFCHFKGKIDEVSVSSIARNSDWIRLCYMNQRSDDRLVQFK